VEIQPHLEPAKPLEVEPAASPELPLVSAEAQPILVRVETLQVQPVVTELPVATEVHVIVEREEPPSSARVKTLVPADAEPQPAIDVAGLEVQPAVNPATPAPLNAEIQPTLQRPELHADNSQLLDRIDQQRIANDVVVDQPADAATYASEVECAEPRQPVSTKVEPALKGAEPVEIQPAVNAKVPLLVNAELEPILETAELVETQPAASTELPAPVSAEIQPTLACAEPLDSGRSQALHDNIVRQNILDALTADRLTDAVTHDRSEVQPAVRVERSFPVCAKVEPKLDAVEPLPAQPATSEEVPLPIGIKVEPILDPIEPLEARSAASAEAPLAIGTTVEPIPERAELREVRPVARPEVHLPASTKVRPILERTEPHVQSAASQELPLSVGSRVWAVCKIGSVTKGTPGIITGAAEARFFWQSPTYLCTFANNMKVRVRPKDIEPYNHAHSLEELEQSDLQSIQSRRMTLRAEKLLSRQRPTRLHSPTQL